MATHPERSLPRPELVSRRIHLTVAREIDHVFDVRHEQSPARSAALPRTTQMVAHLIPLRFPRPHLLVAQEMNPLGDKLTA